MQIELSNYSLNTSIETLVEHLFIEMDFSRVHLDNNVIIKRICIALDLMIILFLLPRNVYYISHCSDTNIKNNTIYTRILQRSKQKHCS